MALIAAEIIKCTQHPDANKLQVCDVFDGKNTVQIVCGARNARLGLKTILAPLGSRTPKGLLIREANLRGVTSTGMLCSAKDLDLSNEDGIIELPGHIPAGTPLEMISKEFLSATPWHLYSLVDTLLENQKTKKLISIKNYESLPQGVDYKIISQTFFQDGQYHYRHFKI